MAYSERLEFKLKGIFEDKEIDLSNIPLLLLSSFAEDISKLIKSVNERSSNGDILVSIESGSVCISPYVSKAESNILSAELNALFNEMDYSRVGKARRPIFESWSKITQKNPDIQITVGDQNEPDKFIWNSNQTFENPDCLYVDAELYLYGEVLNWGGSKTPNIHLKAHDGKLYIIKCKKEDIKEDQTNRVYQNTGIRVSAKYDINTNTYNEKEYTFIEFVDYSPIFNQDELSSLVGKGTKAWKDVKDHIKWIRETRGYE